ncbi:hypothetical protein PanWU01x14_049370 [Parasponia andersonii]|uniref:Uncharacterized protein n=1 Tax=Parasponia andersonii TaxID=3476 RepID=A0A2P5DML3_PARAD|nr:hypothetical protein PanWU01x14_049370 [Parasponia andersonii]
MAWAHDGATRRSSRDSAIIVAGNLEVRPQGWHTRLTVMKIKGAWMGGIKKTIRIGIDFGR